MNFKALLDAFYFAMQFLTVFPLKPKAEPDGKMAGMAAAMFPAAGLCLGLAAAFADRLLYHFFPPQVTALIIVLLLVVLTGGLHQDGVADTFDGLGSGKDRQGMLDIMRDSRIGTMGVIAVVSSLWLKALAIAALPPHARMAALVMLPTVGRWGMTLPLYTLSYAREKSDGKSGIFFGAVDTRSVSIATLVMLVPAFALLRFKGMIAAAVAAAAAYAFARFMNKKLSGVTGDVLGCVNELTEILFLLILVFFGK